MLKDWERHRMKAVRMRIARRIHLMRHVLFLERLWLSLWPAVFLIGLYAALGLWGLWEQASAFFHGTVFFGLFAIVVALSLYRLRHMQQPTIYDARRRLEEDGKAAHRPLDAVFDPPFIASGGADLWRHHRILMLASADRLQVHMPRLSLVYQDPRALRTVVLLALFTGVLYAGNDTSRRLAYAFSPDFYEVSDGAVLDAWITPPDYTGKSPVMLESGSMTGDAAQHKKPAISVPQGSLLSLRLNGGTRTPYLVEGETETAFETVGKDDHRLEITLVKSGEKQVMQGRAHIASWPLSVIADSPPVIGFSGPPGESRRQALKVDYTLDDDYGVTEAFLMLTPVDGGDGIEVALRGAQTRNEPVMLTVYEDLTAHIYAGRMVSAQLKAEDAMGQVGLSDSLEFRLPERIFTHPVAKELVAIRKQIVIKPSQAVAVADRLDRLSRGLDAYEGDMTAFSAMRSAYWRLGSDRRKAAALEVADILWETALRLEDGQMSLATRSLRDALDAFEQAMDGDMSGLDRAADALQSMMQQFLSQMARQQGELAPMRTDAAQPMQIVGADMIQQMIRQMRDLAAAGETEAAMRMLEQIRDLMENATTNTMTAQDYARMTAMNEAISRLDKLSEQQRDVLNRTSRQTLLNRLREQRGDPTRSFGQLGAEQQELTEQLGAVNDEMKGAGADIPDALGRAERAMGEATDALSGESGTGAIRGQAEAMRALEDAREALQQALDQTMAQMPSGSGLDPLGRPGPGFNTRGFALPDMMDARQVEQILKELRQRIGDPALSETEKAYLRRLLRRF